jgi:hypothetical protein
LDVRFGREVGGRGGGTSHHVAFERRVFSPSTHIIHEKIYLKIGVFTNELRACPHPQPPLIKTER